MTLHLVRTSALLLGLFCTLTVGCDDKDGDEKSEASETPDKSGKKDGGNADAPEAAASVRTFDEDQRKKGCEMLTPKIAADTLGVPEGELEQMKMMGCIYTWKNADNSEIAEGAVMSIFIREDAERARTHFENATKNKTAQEVRAELAKVMQTTKESKEIDTESKKKAADMVGGMAGMMIPEGGYQYTDVPGVGDAARASSEDGALTVLVGNMVFNVRAYKGKPQPALDMSGISPTDTNAVISKAKEADIAWKAATLEVRKAEGTKLARAVVAAL